MQIKGNNRADKIIDTPLDDPTQFSPSWRHEVAELFVSDPKIKLPEMYKDYHKDEWIRKHAEFLKSHKTGTVKRSMDDYRLAHKWFNQERESSTKFKLEPLLLTPVGFTTIGKALAGKDLGKEPFEVYERVFFNIRDENFDLHQSCHLRMYFALPEETSVSASTSIPELWKVVGVQGGYMGLCRLWVWHSAPDIEEFDTRYLSQEAWRTAQSTMLERMVRGKMKDFDLINWAGKFTESERLRTDSNTEDSGANKMATMLLNVLSHAAPKVLEVSRTVDDLNAINSKLEEKRKIAVLKPEELSGQDGFGKGDVQQMIKQRITGEA